MYSHKLSVIVLFHVLVQSQCALTTIPNTLSHDFLSLNLEILCTNTVNLIANDRRFEARIARRIKKLFGPARPVSPARPVGPGQYG